MSQEILDLADIIDELGQRWQPHAGQIPIGSALFYQGFKNIFAECGRNFGKTEIAAYSGCRWGMQYPGSETYIFLPLLNQAREILWASNRIQDFIPPHWIADINKVDMRITLTSGSFIKLDGSNNEDRRRGIKPGGLIVYDEFKDHKYSFVKAMEPNRAAKNAPALFIGTPPSVDNHFVQYAKMAKKNPKWFYHHAPTSANPYISREWLADMKQQLIDLGEEEEWLREYEAVFVKGGKGHLLPQFLWLEKKLILPNDPNKWVLYTICDPASSSTFGVLFVLFNPYTRKIIVVDEIYEQIVAEMTTRKVWKRIKEKVEKYRRLGVDTFEFVYDEAATWFKNEMSEESPDTWFVPTCKANADKESGLSLFKDLLSYEMVEVSPECVKFIWECENYVKDDKGRIPKKDDHLIDCFRYFLDAAGFTFTKIEPPKEKDLDMERRAYTIEEELIGQNEMQEID